MENEYIKEEVVPISQEVDKMLVEVKSTIKLLLQDYDPNSPTFHISNARLDSLFTQLRLDYSGELAPLSIYKSLTYSSSRDYFENQLQHVRDKSERIVQEIEEILEEDDDEKEANIALIKYFILEQILERIPIPMFLLGLHANSI
jgi:hypothetical protein